MEQINYHQLMDYNPFKLDTVVNQLGQTVDFYENPLRGDSDKVIAVFHNEKIAVKTDFYDCGDFYEDSDYNPVLLKTGEVLSFWETID